MLLWGFTGCSYCQDCGPCAAPQFNEKKARLGGILHEMIFHI